MPAQRRKTDADITAVEVFGPGLFRVDLEGEGIGAGVKPGTFAMLEAPDRPDLILLRPFSYFLAPHNDQVAFLLKIVGQGTAALAAAEIGTPVGILGPLGNSFPDLDNKKTWMVAGGVGAAPFGELVRKPGARVLFGAKKASETGFARALQNVGATVEVATDDGSVGFAGTVVQLLRKRLEEERPEALFVCGPTVMMRAVAAVARQSRLPCWVSLEERMACGFAICRGCAHLDATGGWRCICEDGPVYPSETIFAPEQMA